MAVSEMEMKTMHRPKKVKRVSVSSKRQISIPKEFYDTLGFGEELQVELHANSLVLKRINDNFDDFSSDILKDLVDQGYQGDELVKEFEARKSKVPYAMNKLFDELEAEAEEVTLDELFGEDEDDV